MEAMPLFRRRRRSVGTYEAPAPSEPPPLERVLEDGVMIAESSVRMTLRNRIIVDALRDRLDLDRDALAAAAADAFEVIADQEWEAAERSRMRRSMQRVDDPLQDPEHVEHDRESERREGVHRALSSALAERAGQAEALAALVERARLEAWDEIGAFVAGRAEPPDIAPDADYARERGERLATFLALDLMELAAERGVELE